MTTTRCNLLLSAVAEESDQIWAIHAQTAEAA